MDDNYVSLTTLTQTAKEQALKKYTIIQPFLNQEKSLPAICQSQCIPLRTARTWVKRYRQQGLVGLAKKARRDKQTKRCCTASLQQFIEGLYLKQPHWSAATLYRKVKDYAQTHHLQYPSYRSVCRTLQQIPAALTTLAHEGSKKYKEKFDLLFRHEAKGANDIWQADHTLLDILITHDQGKTARPWLTIIMDDYSRAIIGYELSLMAPSAMKTALALRQAIWRKKEPYWPMCGIPATLYTDHGSDFTSQHIEQVCIQLKINLIFSQIGEPRGRGKIERFFLTLNQMLLSEQEGYTGSQQPKATLTLVELNYLVHAFIRDYNQRQHPTTHNPPQQCWEKNGFLPSLPDAIEQLDLLLLTFAKLRKIQRDGIRFQGLRYLDPVLADYVGESVLIRYDPADLTSIRVFYNDQYLCQPICQDLDQQAVSLKEIQTARHARRKTLQAEIKQRLSLVDAILNSKQRMAIINEGTKKAITSSPLKLYNTDE